MYPRSLLAALGGALLILASLIGHTPSGATKQQDITLFDNGNIYAVSNGPQQPTTFRLSGPAVVTVITDYHWNNARGSRPGSIALRSSTGRTFGPWTATGSPGQGGVPNALWTVYPQTVVPAGDYTVIDSDNATWSQNSGSGGKGFSKVTGHWVQPAPTPTSTVSRTPVPSTGTRSTVITENRSRSNVLIWPEGKEPKTMMDVLTYHLEPAWKGTLAVTIPASGQVTFIAGDGSKGPSSAFDRRIGSCVWSGDPHDASKLPYIIFEANGSMTCSTVAKR